MPINVEEFRAHLEQIHLNSKHAGIENERFDRAQAREQIFTDKGWHEHVLRTVASSVARGFDDFEIHAVCEKFTRKGYTKEETRQEVERMIHGARAKGFAPASVYYESNTSCSRKPLLTMIGDLKQSPVKYLIDGILECQSLIGLVGASGCGKSFVAIDMAMSIATGLPYHGRSVEQGLVIMCVGEGHSGMPARCESWCSHHSVCKSEAKLAVTDRAADLFNETYVERFYEEIKMLIEKFGPPQLIVIDTVARHMPGMDENSAKDMGSLIQIADTLKQEFNCSIMFVHHTGLANHDRARGSSAFKAALDTEILLATVGGNDIAMKCDKQKDGPPFEQMQFVKVSVENSLILQQVDYRCTGREKKTSEGEKFAMEVLQATIDELGQKSVHLEEWRKQFNRRHPGDNPKSKSTAFMRARKTLVQKKFIMVNDDYYSFGDKAT